MVDAGDFDELAGRPAVVKMHLVDRIQVNRRTVDTDELQKRLSKILTKPQPKQKPQQPGQGQPGQGNPQGAVQETTETDQ